MDNKISTWKQGYYARDLRNTHRNMETTAEVARINEHEGLLVRPAPTENAICTATSPDAAEWIAKRLNRAAELEAKLFGMGWDLEKV